MILDATMAAASFAAESPPWLAVVGRTHPILLHFPFGLLGAAALVEWFLARRSSGLPRAALSVLVPVAAASAVLAAATGWLLHQEPGYEGDVVELHQWLGIAVAGLAAASALCHALSRGGTRRGWLTAHRGFLFASVVTIFPAGHFGGQLTHGEGFLLGPLERGAAATAATVAAASDDAPTPAPGPAAPSYARDVAPILAARCAECHAGSKRKGGLALDTPRSIQEGGKHGPILSADAPGESELLARLLRPRDQKGHMPPRAKPQPTPEEIAAIEKWVVAGAPFDADTASPAGDAAAPAGDAATSPPSVSAEPDAPAPVAALAALQEALVHAESLAEGSRLLWIDFAPVAASIEDARAAALLEPLREHVAHLGLARTRAGAETLALCARMPRLARLDLRATPVDDGALAALAGHASLRTLVLAKTSLTDDAADTLLDLPALERVHLWQSGIGAEARARLRTERPDLSVEDGADEGAPVLAEEAPPKLGPKPAAQSAVAASLAPANTVCPVSGSALDPKYTIVFEGRVIGFCCPKCPSQFWADPKKFTDALR